MEERVPFRARAVHQGLRLSVLGCLVGQDAHDQQALRLVLKVDAVVRPRLQIASSAYENEHQDDYTYILYTYTYIYIRYAIYHLYILYILYI